MCTGKGILYKLHDVLNSVVDSMMMKRWHMPTCVEARHIEWRNITNAILYIGLMTWCHKCLHLEKITSWRRIKRAHYACEPRILDILLDILIYFRIRHSFAHLRPVILSADWSISRLQSWTCSSLPDCRWICKTYAEFCHRNSATVLRLV